MAFQLDQQELHCSVQKFTDMCGKSLSEKFKIAVEQMFNYNTKQTSLALDTLHCDQKLSLVMLYSLIKKDLALFASAMQIFSELYRGKFTTLENWLKDEFSFAKKDIITAVSRLAQLVSKGVLQINKQILQVFSGLELKYNLKKYFIESGDDTALGFINNLISEDKIKTPTTSQTPPNSSVISKEEAKVNLESAIRNNNLALIEVLILKGADINKKTKSGDYPLHIAVCHGTTEAIKALLNQRVILDLKNSTGHTPLYCAVCNNKIDCARLLLNAGAEVDSKNSSVVSFLYDDSHPDLNIYEFGIFDSDYECPYDKKKDLSPLHQAVIQGNLEMVELLVKHGADVNNKLEYWTPFYIACKYRHLKIAELLIKCGADINTLSYKGWTPFYQAINNANLPVIEFLLGNGADPNILTVDNGWAAIHEAILKGHKAVTKLLLEWGVNANMRAKNGFTPLHLANDSDMAQLLVSNGAVISLQSEDGSTPLHTSASVYRVSVVEFLLKQGADVKAQDNNRCTALHRVTVAKTSEVLLKYGSDINAKGKGGWTPLHQAIRKPALSVIEKFLEHGADVNLKSDDGWTPLHLAAVCNYSYIVEILIGHGANINSEGFNLTTPLHWAIKGGDDYVVEFLLEHGADINAKLKDGCTPLTLARMFGNLNVVKILLTRSGKLT